MPTDKVETIFFVRFYRNTWRLKGVEKFLESPRPVLAQGIVLNYGVFTIDAIPVIQGFKQMSLISLDGIVASLTHQTAGFANRAAQ